MAARRQCECCDKGCPVHPGEECERKATTKLRRIDWHGQPRVDACMDCASDMLDSGVFA